MNFDYIVYNGGYDLWRFFLNNGYPISIEVIQDLIIEGGYKVKIENIYKTDYIKLKDKSIQFIEDHQFGGQIDIYYEMPFDFNLFDKVETQILRSKDIDCKILKEIRRLLWISCRHAYYMIVEYEPNFLLSTKSQLIYNVIFIDPFNDEYENSFIDFIEKDLVLFDKILINKGLNYFHLKNELQGKVLKSISKLKLSKSDYSNVININYNIEKLINESHFSLYLISFFEGIQTIISEDIIINVTNIVKDALKDRISKIVNFPGAPNQEWLDRNWNLLGTGQSDDKLNDVTLFIESSTPAEDINPIEASAQEIYSFKQKRDDLKRNLENAGILELDLVKSLKPDKYILLINHLYENKLPYVIAMFKHIGFLDYLSIEYKTKKEIHSIIASWVGLSNSRGVKGNIDVLNPRSEDNRTRYTSYKYLEEVKEFYDTLK